MDISTLARGLRYSPLRKKIPCVHLVPLNVGFFSINARFFLISMALSIQHVRATEKQLIPNIPLHYVLRLLCTMGQLRHARGETIQEPSRLLRLLCPVHEWATQAYAPRDDAHALHGALSPRGGAARRSISCARRLLNRHAVRHGVEAGRARQTRLRSCRLLACVRRSSTGSASGSHWAGQP